MRRGFTLIELSIVLVIIGLIVGGVLGGQDLIKAAEIRATVGQYEKFNAANNTFRLKYNGLAGDLKNATQFGWTQPNIRPGIIAGDGLLQSSAGTALDISSEVAGQETTNYWYQMSAAGLIGQTLIDPGPDVLAPTTAIDTDTIRNYFPTAKIGSNNFWLSFNLNGYNHYAIFNLGSIRVNYGGDEGDVKNGLSPNSARMIDTKIDDGLPMSGIVLARTSYFYSLAFGPDPTCASATNYVNSTDLLCGLNLRFQ